MVSRRHRDFSRVVVGGVPGYREALVASFAPATGPTHQLFVFFMITARNTTVTSR
jgi:hypothetical protein